MEGGGVVKRKSNRLPRAWFEELRVTLMARGLLQGLLKIISGREMPRYTGLVGAAKRW